MRLANAPLVEQKARVKDEHTTKSKTSIGKLLLWALVVLFLGGIGRQAWKLNAYNAAVREAKDAGFRWECEDAFSLIKQDWRNALNKVTWGPHLRVLEMGDVPDLGHYREMLCRLRPTVLHASGCNDENVDALTALTGLTWLELTNCPALQNVDALKGLTGLRSLELGDCTSLQNVDALKSLTALEVLILRDCTALQNVDALKNLTALKTLHLRDCPSLQNVDALKGLTSLQKLALQGSDKIPAAALRELRAALPKTDITFPDATGNPPQ